MNALEKCMDMLLAVTILFFIPLLFYSGGSRIIRSLSAGAACENFLKRVCTAGEITWPVWKELETALERYGCDEYELRRKYTLWEPGEKPGDVTEQCYTEEEEKLLETIRTEGVVSLHKGDKLRVICYIDDFPTVYYGVVRSEGTVR